MPLDQFRVFRTAARCLNFTVSNRYSSLGKLIGDILDAFGDLGVELGRVKLVGEPGDHDA